MKLLQKLLLHLSIKSQFVLILAITGIPLLLFIGMALATTFQNYQLSEEVVSLVDFAKVSTRLIHDVQKERGLSNNYLGNPTEERKKEMLTQRDNADAQWRQMEAVTQKDFKEKADTMKMVRKQWVTDRVSVDAKTSTPELIQKNYTYIISEFIKEGNLGQAAGSSIFSDRLRVLHTFLLWKDTAGQLRSNLNVSLTKQEFTRERYLLCLDAISKKKMIINILMDSPSRKKIELFVAKYEGQKYGEIVRFLKDNDQVLPKISQEEWWAISTQRMDELQIVIEEEVKELYGLVSEERNKNLYILIGLLFVSFFSVALSFFVTVMITRRIQAEIIDISEVMAKAEQGELVEIKEIPGKDEIAKLSRSFSSFSKFNKSLILELKESSQDTKEIGDQALQLAEDFSKTALSLASGSEEISAASEEMLSQSESVKNSVASSESSVQLIKKDILKAAKVATEMNDLIKRLQENANLLQKYSNYGTEMMGSLEAQMTEVQARSKEIHSVLKMINDISGRTNLLSLNAAIEAARAGESGRGFAVVAENIASLAQNSVTSVKKIETIIGNLNTAIEKGVENIKENISSLGKISESSQDNLRQVGTVSENMLTSVQINKTIEGQIVSISDKFTEVKQATDENIEALRSIQEGITAISIEAEAMNKDTAVLRTSMQELQKNNKSLSEKVAFFHD